MFCTQKFFETSAQPLIVVELVVLGDGRERALKIVCVREVRRSRENERRRRVGDASARGVFDDDDKNGGDEDGGDEDGGDEGGDARARRHLARTRARALV